MFLWDASSPSLWFAHFLDKITVPGPNSLSLDYGPVTCKQDELRLSNISKTAHCTPQPGLFISSFFPIVFLYPSCQFYAHPPHCGWLFHLRQPMAVPSGADQCGSGSQGGHRKPMAIRGWRVEVRIWGALRENLGE